METIVEHDPLHLMRTLAGTWLATSRTYSPSKDVQQAQIGPGRNAELK